MERTVLRDINDTEALGRRIAEGLEPGSVVALTGPLGAGKTTLAQAIARGLCVTERLSSPTFTIVQEYESGRLPLYHFDVYRVHDEDELFEIGFDEYLHGDGVCLVEWADLVEDLLPENTVRVELDYGSEEDERVCTVRGFGVPDGGEI